MARQEKQPEKLDTAHISKALGTFLAVFGLVILFAILYTDTTSGKVTNAIAGLVIGGIGVGMILRASKKK